MARAETMGQYTSSTARGDRRTCLLTSTLAATRLLPLGCQAHGVKAWQRRECGNKLDVLHVQGAQFHSQPPYPAAHPQDRRPTVAKGITLQLRAHLMMRAAGSGRHASDAIQQPCSSRQWDALALDTLHAGDAMKPSDDGVSPTEHACSTHQVQQSPSPNLAKLISQHSSRTGGRRRCDQAHKRMLGSSPFGTRGR